MSPILDAEIIVVLMFCSVVFEPGCERSVGAADAETLSALEAAIFRDLPALLSTVPFLLRPHLLHFFSLVPVVAGKRAARCGF
jgi:hypothetical protein